MTARTAFQTRIAERHPRRSSTSHDGARAAIVLKPLPARRSAPCCSVCEHSIGHSTRAARPLALDPSDEADICATRATIKSP